MVDASELIKGLCIAYGHDWRGLRSLTVTPFEIEFTVMARNSAGQVIGEEQHSYSVDRSKFNG